MGFLYDRKRRKQEAIIEKMEEAKANARESKVVDDEVEKLVCDEIAAEEEDEEYEDSTSYNCAICFSYITPKDSYSCDYGRVCNKHRGQSVYEIWHQMHYAVLSARQPGDPFDTYSSYRRSYGPKRYLCPICLAYVDPRQEKHQH